MSRTGRRAAWWLPALLVLASCGGEPDPLEGVAVEARPALELLRLASGGEPGVETLTALIRPDLLDRDPTGLLDNLGAVGPAASWEVVAVDPLPDLRRVAVDLRANLDGGGTAAFTVQTELGDDGTWWVVWFGGPDLEWPIRTRRRDTGLSSSAPPESD